MKGQSKDGAKGGSMRLGSYDCELTKGSKICEIYGENSIQERHRHRLEVNNQYRDKLVEKGLIISGVNKKLDLVETIEIEGHPFYIACQYHPEFKSKPHQPHPLFKEFVKQSDLFGENKS